MLGYLCTAARQWYLDQLNEKTRRPGRPRRRLAAHLAGSSASGRPGKTPGSPARRSTSSTRAKGLAYVFQVIAIEPGPAMKEQHPGPARRHGATANRAFADLIEPSLNQEEPPNNLLVANVLWTSTSTSAPRACSSSTSTCWARSPSCRRCATTPRRPRQLSRCVASPSCASAGPWSATCSRTRRNWCRTSCSRTCPEDKWGEEEARLRQGGQRDPPGPCATRPPSTTSQSAPSSPAHRCRAGEAGGPGGAGGFAREIAVTAKLAIAYRELGDKAKANALAEADQLQSDQRRLHGRHRRADPDRSGPARR